MGRLISDKYREWEEECKNRFDTLKANEEELNRIFIDIYGLQDELTPEVSDKDVTVRLADKEREIKSLISYMIGIIMGRYSLDDEGLIYAGGEWDSSKYKTYQPDEDGILPIYLFNGMTGGLDNVICNLIKFVYGEDTYKENIDFIAEVLGRLPEEDSEATINRYLNDNFYTEHLKIYQKRPIYWMLSSGKQGAFKCLIYLHRYTENTLAIINSKYFLPRTALYKSEKERIEFKLNSADLELREKRKLETELTKIEACIQELYEYGQILDYLANQYIELDLDDGVKVNYVKFQNISLEVNGATIKKNLLIPFGLEEKKK